ncbi:hypothetical protein DNTS_002581 [Danionella cerebrum]|uniref:Formiminotransferase C-terminal subdomain domain-containing protein n=1 Tax=Danionella cerebrum TaxID=2873325 RepID=A0A553RHB1_9TELE|nr:hypothetical protein DNTS_002581 [Danionella translucida]
MLVLSKQELNLPVVGSQIVGLIPLKAMLDCAEFYIQRENLFVVEEEHKIRLVISKLGLDSLGPFDPKERIVEYMVQANQGEDRLVSLSLQKFVQSVGARTAAPGGGSVSAAIAAMGAALGCMVGQMTYGKRQFESVDAEMRKLIPPLHRAMNDLLLKVDADSSAFNSYMVHKHTKTHSRGEATQTSSGRSFRDVLTGRSYTGISGRSFRDVFNGEELHGHPMGGASGMSNGEEAALKLPKGTAEEIKRREEAMQQGLKSAVSVPLSLAERVDTLWPVLKEMVKYGNVACKSDIQVAAKALETAVYGAYYNVIINLKDITDSSFRAETEEKVSSLLKNARENTNVTLETAEQRK